MNTTQPLRQKEGTYASIASSAFSLVELLVVMAVIAILMAMTLPALTSMGKGRGLTTAGNMTVDVINHARQVARARNSLTMVAMINTGTDAGRVLTSLVYSATNGTNGTWTPIDRWRTFPEGVVIINSGDFFKTPPPSAGSLMKAGASLSSTDYSSAVFLPDGRPMNATSVPQFIELTNATMPKNFYKIIVNQATGIPAVRRP